jgi:hypothetical protein
MPFKTVHAARVRSPGSFTKGFFRTRQLTRGITAIMGRLKGKSTMTIQSYRFDKKLFTAAKARKWLRDKKIKILLFEKAV